MARAYGFLLSATLFALTDATHAQAIGCSAEENRLLAENMPRMIEALLQGDVALFQDLANATNARLSPPCQMAIMHQQQRQVQQQRMSPRRPYSGGSRVIEGSDGTLYGPGVACPPTGGCILTQ